MEMPFSANPLEIGTQLKMAISRDGLTKPNIYVAFY